MERKAENYKLTLTKMGTPDKAITTRLSLLTDEVISRTFRLMLDLLEKDYENRD